MSLMIHVCCAHCLAKTLTGLREEFGSDQTLVGVFYNPNIHPLLEFRRRLKAVHVYLERDFIEMAFVEEYGLRPFCQAAHGAYDPPKRCEICYQTRLAYTAHQAKERGFDIFTSTLVTSRHQDHELIRAIGEAEAAKNGIRFLYRDFRDAEPPARLIQGLYRQQYCGCVFSEAERFSTTSKHLYRGPDGKTSSE